MFLNASGALWKTPRDSSSAISVVMNGCSRGALATAVLAGVERKDFADLRPTPSATGSWPLETRGTASAGPPRIDAVVVHVLCTQLLGLSARGLDVARDTATFTP